jgi:hypothetical protein
MSHKNKYSLDELVSQMKPEHNQSYNDTIDLENHPVPKVALDLNPPEAVEAMALAFMDGAKKYGVHDWEQKGFNSRERLAAITRHTMALMMEQTHAQDSGLHHAAHILADAAMIYTQYVRGKSRDETGR